MECAKPPPWRPAGRVRRYRGDIPPVSWWALLSLQKIITKIDHLCMTIDLDVGPRLQPPPPPVLWSLRWRGRVAACSIAVNS